MSADHVAFAKNTAAVATLDLGAATATISSLAVTLYGGSSSAFDQKIQYVGADGSTILKEYTNSLSAGNWAANTINKTDVVPNVRYIKIFGASKWVVMSAFSITFASTESPFCVAPFEPIIAGGGYKNLGDEVTLTATATSGIDANTTYTWYRGNSGYDAAVAAGTIQATSTTNTYHIASCAAEDAAVYYCIMSNGDGCESVGSVSISVTGAGIYILTYDANAGTDEVNNLPGPESHTPGTYILSTLVPTREGYTFGDWYRNAECTGDHFAAGASFTTGALDETLYAKWIPIAVTGVSLNKGTTTIAEGETETLVATITPANALDQAVTWSSSDESVVTVSSAGIVTAVGEGTATITVTTHDGGYTATCAVTVVPYVACTTIISYAIGSNPSGNAKTSTASGIIGGTAYYKLSGGTAYDGQTGYKLNGNGHYFGLTLADGKTFKTGDKLTVYITQVSGMTGATDLGLFTTQTASGSPLQTAAVVLGENTITLSSAFNGATSVYIDRSSDYDQNHYLYSMSVCRTPFTVTYKPNGGTGSDIADDEAIVVADNSFDYPGYIFTGWNTAANGSGTPYAKGDLVPSNLTLYAQWVAAYTITYNGNGNTGGSAPTDSNSPYATGSTVTVLDKGTLAKDGYAFTGWNAAANGSGTQYAPGATFSINTNTILYAQWTAAYTLVYDANGADSGNAPTDNSSPYATGSTVTVLGNTGSLAKAGHVFNGWNTAANGSGTQYAPGTTFTINANTILYAQWAATYTVTYDGNGATNTATLTDSNSPYVSGSTVTVLSNTGIWFKTGSLFAGWNTKADGTGTTYAAGSTFSITGNTTLYAKWQAKPALFQYILGSCYVKDGIWTQGSNGEFGAWLYEDGTLIETTDITWESVNTASIFYLSKDLTKLDNSSYWTTSSSPDRAIKGFAVASGSTQTFSLGSLEAYSIILYAFPRSNNAYALELTTNGHTESVSIAANGKDQWHRFACEGGSYTGDYSIKNNDGSEVRCVVIVEIPAITIHYDANGGYGTMSDQLAMKGGEVTLHPNAFDRDGYKFAGWATNPEGTGTIYEDEATFHSNADVTLYAVWKEPCQLTPTLHNITPIMTLWDGQYTDMSVIELQCDYDTTNVKYSLQSVSGSIAGCTFTYYDSKVHIVGTPSIGNTSTVTRNVTFTFTNNCSPANTYTVTQEFRIYKSGQKARIALILTGTKGGSFNAYDTGDADDCADLITYLTGHGYDVQCVNGYATKDPIAIAEYYDDFDLLIVTDFMETPEGYTNAIGTLIDRKPILSFEAYVAGKNGSNWHIGSNPADPDPKVKKMKILCAGHAVFGDAEGVDVINDADTTVSVLSTTSGKGLQGFVINEAPDFIFLATVRDANNNRDLIVCCERQVVFPARLLIYGINYNEMGNLSQAGKIVMRQMIDYLLLTDETRAADCSLIFDDHNGTHRWADPANWYPGYNIVPTPYHPTRIIKECHVDVPNAHAGSVKINVGEDHAHNALTGRLIIEPEGGLTIAGAIQKVINTRYLSPTTTDAEDILIKANATHNGSLVFGNKETDLNATVEYYSRATGAGTSSPIWQYIGIPFQASQTAISLYHYAWMCRWTTATTDNIGGLWQWVKNEDVLIPFEGYCITQESSKTYTFSGKLNKPIATKLNLDNYDSDGFAFAANSWTAPIKIQEMTDDDFSNAEKSIYIYHTGSYANWESNGTPVNATTTAATLPGQYAVIPIHSSPYLAGADSVIPSMQGFFVKTTSSNPKLNLVYSRAVYDSKYFKTSTQPMRINRRVPAESEDPEVMRILLNGTKNGGDQVYLLVRNDFNEEFMDGWDGRKIDGNPVAPKLAVMKESGEMAVAAIESADDRYLLFRAGKDSTYTFSFEYNGEKIYLYDQLTEQATEIKTGNTYSFTETNTNPLQRFLITTHPKNIPTDITIVESDGLLHFENYDNQLIQVSIVDMQGRVVYSLNSTDEIVDITPSLPLGVYLVHVNAGSDSRVFKLIGKEGAQ